MSCDPTSHAHHGKKPTRKNTMKTSHALRFICHAGVGSLLATAAVASYAQAQEGGYYYWGLGIGQSRARIDEDRISASLLGAGLTMSSISRDERDTGYKVFGGYQINRNFGLEAGYFKLGKFGFHAVTVPAGTLDGEIKLQGLNLDLVGTLPLSERWSALGRVGAQYARASDSFSGTGAVGVSNPSPSKSALNPKLGLGLQYAFSPSFLVRGEAERYRINDAVGNHGDVNLYSVSLVFPFGRAPAPAPRAMAAPAPAPVMQAAAPVVVEAAPPPPPPPPPPVVVPPRRRVKFEADSLFTFAKADVHAEGKAQLDTLAKELKSTQFQTVTVEGHTDRLGTAAYNQSLSNRRAETVKNYLVQSGGVDASKITSIGKGETEPVTKPGDCKGNKPTPKLIACLQPDRRVEVEVVGTQP